jgi:hypothetical protein
MNYFLVEKILYAEERKQNNKETIMNTIFVGQSDFKRIREQNGYYVDKSLFIEEILKSPFLITLITRPRRFGKTINLSLLRYFLEKTDQDHSALFDGLAIKQSDMYTDHFLKYPVIYLTFKDIKSPNWNESFEAMKVLISQLFEYHAYLLDSNCLSERQVLDFKEIVDRSASKVIYENALKMLSEFLYQYHNKLVIILVDEYDTPIHTGYQHNYYNEVISFMRNLFSSGLKDNSNIFRGVVTGTLRISKESIFTGLNNLGVFTSIQKRFNNCFGFDETEVKKMLADFDLSEQYSTISKWYDGYNFGEKKIFNPWSVVNYISNSDSQPEPYWLNTSSMEMIENVITPNKELLREELNDLIEGKPITKILYENMRFSDIINPRSELVWSFLLHSGYLKITKEVESNLRRTYEIQIPNREVRIIYIELIEKWIKNRVELRQLETLLNAMKNGNISFFEKHLKKICLEIMSYHDFAGSPEKVYHALVLGMLVWLSNDYVIRSNRESGYGRYDIIFIPKKKSNQGIIIEFKRIDDDEIVEDVLNDALKQIEEKRYDVELKAANIENIIKLAIGFTNKSVYLKQSTVQE